MCLTKKEHYSISFDSLLPILNHKNFNTSLLIEKNNLCLSFMDLIKEMPNQNNQHIILQEKLNKFILNATIKEASNKKN